MASTCSDLAVFGTNDQATNEQIEIYRKGDTILKVYDGKGNPISGASIRYQQVTSDYLFGVGATRGDRPNSYYDQNTWMFLKEGGINYALPYLSWNFTMYPSWISTAFNPIFLYKSGVDTLLYF